MNFNKPKSGEIIAMIKDLAAKLSSGELEPIDKSIEGAPGNEFLDRKSGAVVTIDMTINWQSMTP